MTSEQLQVYKKFCKGLCVKLKTKKVSGIIYEKFKRCRTCNCYFRIIEVGRDCPCCGRRLRTRPRSPSSLDTKNKFSQKMDNLETDGEQI